MRQQEQRERGSMAVEVVILVPVLIMVMMLIVAFGRYVSAEGATEAAAREAARAASLERTGTAAQAAAEDAARASLPPELSCTAADVSGAFVAGGIITVDLTCQVSWQNLGLIGLNGTVAVSGSSSAPLDQFRRTGGP